MRFSGVITIVTFLAKVDQSNAFSHTFTSNVKMTKSSRTYSSRLKMSSSSNEKSDKHRVVITGLGVVSGCGMGHEDFFQACLDGKSSLDTVKRFDASAYPCTIASEVPDDLFDPTEWFNNVKNIRTNDRFTHLAVAASRMALKDAKIGDIPESMEESFGCENIGVMVGSAFGGMETFEQETLKLNKRPERPKVS